MGDYELSITNYGLQITNYGSSIAIKLLLILTIAEKGNRLKGNLDL